MQGSMMNSSMMLCMAASALSGVVIVVAVVVQVVLQARMLGELRKLNAQAHGSALGAEGRAPDRLGVGA
jgi:hypothetical protein